VRVGFDARGAGDVRGIGRYVRCLLPALRETAPTGWEVVEARGPRGFDLWHAPWIDGALARCPCPQVVTLHDLVPLKRASEYLRTGLRFRWRYAAVRRADRVIVPTRAVASDAAELLRIAASRVAVIGEAPAPGFSARPADEVARVRERHGVPENYLLWVGGLEHPDPRKRVAELAATPRRTALVLAGPAGSWTSQLRDVVLTGFVSDDDLAALYTGARALVIASDDEGFGLPAVEALACGAPVVACDLPALRDAVGDRATFVDRADLAGLVAAAESARRPAPPPPAWSWKDAAQATWNVYAAALES
jgi:glycosyltransferase involved in cell wall biosynthesis